MSVPPHTEVCLPNTSKLSSKVAKPRTTIESRNFPAVDLIAAA